MSRNQFIKKRSMLTIQTHNAVSIPLSAFSTNPIWVDCDGFDKVAMTLLSDTGATPNSINVLWSNDGITQHGYEGVLGSVAAANRQGITDVKARYCKLQVVNGDAAAAHTMSVWVLLKG